MFTEEWHSEITNNTNIASKCTICFNNSLPAYSGAFLSAGSEHSPSEQSTNTNNQISHSVLITEYFYCLSILISDLALNIGRVSVLSRAFNNANAIQLCLEFLHFPIDCIIPRYDVNRTQNGTWWKNLNI